MFVDNHAAACLIHEQFNTVQFFELYMAKLPPLPFFILNGHEGNITALNFNNETDCVLEIKPTLLSGSDKGEIFIWNLKNFRAIYQFKTSKEQIILFLKYYKSKLISQSKDGTINIWSHCNNGWNVIKMFKSEAVGLTGSVFWLSDNKAFMTLLNDRHSLNIYNLDEEKKVKEIDLETSRGLCTSLKHIELKGRQFFLVGYENGIIELRDSEKANQLHFMKFHEDIVTCFDFDTEFKIRGISGSADKFLKVWSISDEYQLESVYELALNQPGTSDLKIRPDGKIVIAAMWDFSIRVFSWKTLKPLAVLKFHVQSIQCIACSPFSVNKKNSVFASGSKDQRIALWTIY